MIENERVTDLGLDLERVGSSRRTLQPWANHASHRTSSVTYPSWPEWIDSVTGRALKGNNLYTKEESSVYTDYEITSSACLGHILNG